MIEAKSRVSAQNRAVARSPLDASPFRKRTIVLQN